MGNIKIIVAGGCHVEGWLVGHENSFVSAFSRRLVADNIPNEIVLKPYAILNKVQSLIEVCQKEQPDVLILQYGNYEFSPSLINQLRKKFKLSRKRKKAYETNTQPSAAGSVSIEPGKIFDITWKFRLTQFIKNLGNNLIFYSWLNKSKWTTITDEAFARIYALNISKVVVLSPFPTANIITNQYRSQGSRILRSLAGKYHFQFVNVLDYLKNKYPNQIHTIDELHLNGINHQKVGDLIFSKVAYDLKSINKKKINQLSFKK